MKLTLEQAEQMMKANNGNLDLYERKEITKPRGKSGERAK